MDAMILYLINQDQEQRISFNEEKLFRKILRDKSDPLSVSNQSFINYYRVNKEAFIEVLRYVEPRLKQTSVPAILKLAASLRFFAVGCYQASVGKDFNIGLGRTTFCKIFADVLNVLQERLCSKWINLNMDEEEIKQSKLHFFTNHGFPGVVGCVDGTHISIITPTTNGMDFLNRKGYYSINAMIVCDFKMKIRAVDACHSGSSHDSLIWSMSEIRQHFAEKFADRRCGSWLLGDAGYGLETFLMTPYRSPSSGTIENKYNIRHTAARNIVERTIGNLKSRFRCLLGARQLNYSPVKASKIINICCALHNICKHYGIEADENTINVELDTNENELEELINVEPNTCANDIRNSIAISFQ